MRATLLQTGTGAEPGLAGTDTPMMSELCADASRSVPVGLHTQRRAKCIRQGACVTV
jgi:hypothetical protein